MSQLRSNLTFMDLCSTMCQHLQVTLVECRSWKAKMNLGRHSRESLILFFHGWLLPRLLAVFLQPYLNTHPAQPVLWSLLSFGMTLWFLIAIAFMLRLMSHLRHTGLKSEVIFPLGYVSHNCAQLRYRNIFMMSVSV